MPALGAWLKPKERLTIVPPIPSELNLQNLFSQIGPIEILNIRERMWLSTGTKKPHEHMYKERAGMALLPYLPLPQVLQS